MAKGSHRAFLVVMDGVGVGNAPDASLYGDEGSDTLGNLATHFGGLNLPTFQALGLGNLSDIQGVDPVDSPRASYGRLEEQSAGKDSVTGHWELCGIITSTPFPVFPEAFPDEIVQLVKEVSGRDVIGNEVASGTEIMVRLGGDHVRSGALILYTSADSVLQILAHEEVVPLEEQYRICETIHQHLELPYRVGRVIARPFVGQEGSFVRTANRVDYAVTPPVDTVLDKIRKAGLPVSGIGKVDTLFAGRGFSSAEHTFDNADGFDRTLHHLKSQESGMVFTNLLDFDTQWGHRNDVDGFKGGLEELDRRLPEWIDQLRPDDLIVITADHGNDPTTPSTDHSREHVPVLAWLGKGGNGKALGLRHGFVDVAATISEHLGVPWDGPGKSFLTNLR